MKKNRNSPVHTNEESGKTDFIIDPLLPVGKENRISSSELVRLAGCGSVRELQKRIAWEREQGAIICSGCGAGYWRPANRDEIKAFVRTTEARAFNTLLAAQGAKKLLKDLEGQEYFDLRGGDNVGGKKGV